jgi:hypothetical protein
VLLSRRDDGNIESRKEPPVLAREQLFLARPASERRCRRPAMLAVTRCLVRQCSGKDYVLVDVCELPQLATWLTLILVLRERREQFFLARKIPWGSGCDSEARRNKPLDFWSDSFE